MAAVNRLGRRHTGYATKRYVEDRLAQWGIFDVGNIWYVDSGGTNSTGISPDKPFTTTAAAVTAATANNGDVVAWMPGHAETLAAAAAIALSKAGLTFINLGEGADAATFTFSATASTMTMTAASCSILGFPLIVPSIDAVVSPIVVSAADCRVDIDVRDASSAIECERAILTTAAADRFKFDVRHHGFTAGNACVNSVRLVGGTGARGNVDFYGLASTAVVEIVTTAAVDLAVTGRSYCQAITNGSRIVVDTITGSTWTQDVWDSVAGARITNGSSGGSAISRGGIRTLTKTGAGLHTTQIPLFTVTGGTIEVVSIHGTVTTDIQNQTTTCQLRAGVTAPAADVALSTAVDIDNDNAGETYNFVGATGVLTPNTAGAKILNKSSATVSQCGWLVPIGDIHVIAGAISTGAITWVMSYHESPEVTVVVA